MLPIRVCESSVRWWRFDPPQLVLAVNLGYNVAHNSERKPARGLEVRFTFPKRDKHKFVWGALRRKPARALGFGSLTGQGKYQMTEKLSVTTRRPQWPL